MDEVQDLSSAELYFEAYGIEMDNHVVEVQTWDELLRNEIEAYLHLLQFCDSIALDDCDLLYEISRRRAFLISICAKSKKPPAS